MPQLQTTRRVSHSAADMFALVADVERYPEFVPLCEALKVRRRVASGEGVDVLTANMTVAYKFLRESFASRVTLDRLRLRIAVEYLEGPFSKLDNRWHFKPLAENACEVQFFIAYEFRSRALAMLMGAMFDAAFRRFAEAFERRADEVYGTRAA
jgi:coenzyme Q-binding protein COQ10